MKLNSIKIGTNNANKLYLGSNIINKIPIEVEGSSSRLPQGYVELDYIENKSKAYINTGFKPNQDTRILLTMQSVTSTYGGVFCGAGGWDLVNGMWFDYENGTTGSLHISWGTKTTWSVFNNVKGDFNVHEYDWNKNSFYRDGTLIETVTYGAFQCTDNLGLFAPIQNGVALSNQDQYVKGKLYSCKIYDDGTLVRDFVPCTNPSNVVGVYDIVNDVFYGSASNNTFTAGSPVSPSGGTVVDYWQYVDMGTPTPPHDYSQDYLTLKIVTAGTIVFKTNNIYYSQNNGSNWTGASNGTTLSVNVGDKVLLKSTRTTYNNVSVFSGSTAYFDVEGNIMSAIQYGDNFTGQTSLSSNDCLANFLKGTNVVNAENLILPATNLSNGCYSHMFENCPYLVTAPALPATNLASKTWVYSEMFRDCVSLVRAPELPSTGFGNYAYNQMFQGCSSLNYVKCLATSTSGGHNNWLLGVSSTGTFVKPASTNWGSGASGIPNGWTIENI